MNDGRITIETHHSSDPQRFRTFTVHFFHSYRIHVILTSTPAVVRAWLRKVRSRFLTHIRSRRLVVGLGVQWNPYYASAATLQLCIGHRCLVFQLFHAPRIPSALRRFLSDTGNTFVGVCNHRDEDMLLGSKHRLLLSNLVDVRDVVTATKGWSRSLSMEELASRILGFKGVEKPERIGRSAWDDYWLSEKQVQYASVDAYLSFSMGKALNVWKWPDSMSL
ncbi:hypothetical protein I3843_01G127700 [Carya illinoinensis]|uniref:3'-5' exonuclease domain-containing protein n=1 Tax=Carya illinoinensis TaxID=32201 RepID=A0A8T1RLC8_CARIL|nr:uncharacterized protein LOC122302578 [Carya illinoinensis]KAG6667957.1 hypothetical protein CIPAW_01G136400 [Carya illinoinensis]KAG6731566.1 hypothetical protein I3842_01G134800 [Carya illinoinensis]KAG7995804.1 hypothetical protein I3843_01G127700 [Carya illinoinensis]